MLFVQRLWRSVKYTKAYLRAYERRRGPCLNRPIFRFLRWPPTASSLGDATPDQAYFNQPPKSVQKAGPALLPGRDRPPSERDELDCQIERLYAIYIAARVSYLGSTGTRFHTR